MLLFIFHKKSLICTGKKKKNTTKEVFFFSNDSAKLNTQGYTYIKEIYIFKIYNFFLRIKLFLWREGVVTPNGQTTNLLG